MSRDKLLKFFQICHKMLTLIYIVHYEVAMPLIVTFKKYFNVLSSYNIKLWEYSQSVLSVLQLFVIYRVTRLHHIFVFLGPFDG